MTLRAGNRPTTALLALALFGLACGGVWAKSSDRNQPTRIGADSSDCSLNEGAPCLLSGNVRIVQGSLDIQAAKADVRRRNGQPQTIKLNGAPVKLKQQADDGGWMNATAAQIDYDLAKDIIVFSGDAHVQQPGKGSIAGERIVYNTRTGQIQSGAAAGSDGGRVNMIFEPKAKAPAGNADKKARPDDAKPEAATPPARQDDK